MAILELDEKGLYCPAGGFYIDPWQPVERAVITHAHASHAHPGSESYLCAAEGAPLLRRLIGNSPFLETAAYGESRSLNGVQVSLHPAGHLPGSAQVRVEDHGEVWVVSGDFKLTADPTCTPFEPLRCHTFVTGAPFGLPIFRWPDEGGTIDALHAWWRGNQEAGKASLLYVSSPGPAQRLLAALDTSIGEVHSTEAIEQDNQVYRDLGIPLPPSVTPADWRRTLILASPANLGTAFARGFGDVSTAMASGWMRIRGTRRRRSLDRGFVLSDHADWPALLSTIDKTGAENVWVTHGFRTALVRWLLEHGRHAVAVETRFEEAQQ